MIELDAHIAAVPYYRYLGLRAEGDDTVILTGDDRHANDDVHIHGGVLTAFLEATALLLLTVDGVVDARTNDLTALFLRPAVLRDTRARVRTVRRGRRFAQLEIDAWQDDAASPVAIGYGTWTLGD